MNAIFQISALFTSVLLLSTVFKGQIRAFLDMISVFLALAVFISVFAYIGLTLWRLS